MEVLTRVDRNRIALLRQRDEFFWLDLRDPSDEDLDSLGELLGLHPLAVEDSREWGQRPKLDAYRDHVLLVYYTARLVGIEARESVVPIEIHIYVAGGFAVTLRRDDCRELETLHESLVAEEGVTEDYVVYQVLDSLTDALMPIVRTLGDWIDQLEDSVLERVQRSQLASIYRLKQDVHTLKRLVAPQLETMETASDAIVALPGLTSGSHPYLRDVVDHLESVRSSLERHSTDLANLVDTFFNANQNRLNQHVTVLTVIATFFLVWTLVTSFFGQNFKWLVDGVATREDFLVFGVGGLVVPTMLLAALFWWRRHDWWQ